MNRFRCFGLDIVIRDRQKRGLQPPFIEWDPWAVAAFAILILGAIVFLVWVYKSKKKGPK